MYLSLMLGLAWNISVVLSNIMEVYFRIFVTQTSIFFFFFFFLFNK